MNNKAKRIGAETTRSFAVMVLMAGSILSPYWSIAQCSMCRAVTGSGQFNEDTFTPGRGLNDAILYLMAMPYLMAAVFIAVFFRKPILAWFRKNRGVATVG